MSDIKEFINTMKINYYETIVLFATFILTLVTDLTIAIPVGFILSIILFMKRMSDSIELTPLLTTKNGDGRILSQEIGPYSDQIMIFEINGPMFFGSVHHLLSIRNRIHTDHKVIILRFRYVPIVDSSGLTKLKLVLRQLEKHNIQVYFTGVNDKIKNKILRNKILDEKRIFIELSEAVRSAEQWLNENIIRE